MTDTAGDIMYDKCAKCKDRFHMDENHNCAYSSPGSNTTKPECCW